MTQRNIRDYIYLDTDRARSLYSQLKGGAMESFIRGSRTNEQSSQNANHEGSLVEQSVLLGTKYEATHVLHDYLFTEIESEMQEDIRKLSSNDELTQMQPGDYIQVSGRAQINDTNRLIEVMKDFNSLHAFVSMAGELHEMQNEIWDLQHEIDFGNLSKREIDRLKSRVESLKPPAKFRQAHAGVPDLTTEMLTLWLNLLYPAVFEVTVTPGFSENCAFRSVIDREFLRENPTLMYAKHSTRTQATWTIVGQITAIYGPQQLGSDDNSEHNDGDELDQDDDGNPSNMRDQLEVVFGTFVEMEKHILVSARASSVVLTPLAIYQDFALK